MKWVWLFMMCLSAYILVWLATSLNGVKELSLLPIGFTLLLCIEREQRRRNARGER